jgi:hypothetical protein
MYIEEARDAVSRSRLLVYMQSAVLLIVVSVEAMDHCALTYVGTILAAATSLLRGLCEVHLIFDRPTESTK